ncbi:Histone-lysine N-methyltransferase [Bertholletia excelsa]
MSRAISSNRSNADKEGQADAAVNQLDQEVVLADVIWVRLQGPSWWPAQVVDGHSVSQRIIPRRRSMGEVLVRLYGSYKYMYVNPITCRAEFENILKQRKGNRTQILKDALKQDLARFRSDRAKRKGSNAEGKVAFTSPIKSQAKQNVARKSQEIECPISAWISPGKTRVSVTQQKVSGCNSISEKNGEARSGKRKQGEIQKKVEPNSLKAARTYPRRTETSGTSQKAVKDGDSLLVKTEDYNSKGQKFDATKRKLEAYSPISTRISQRRLFSQNTVEEKEEKRKEVGAQKKLKRNHPDSIRVSSQRISTVNKAQPAPKKVQVHGLGREGKTKEQKQNIVEKKVMQISPSLVTNLAGKSPELSARRMKVMQSLGLIAPSGSPYHRNGLS